MSLYLKVSSDILYEDGDGPTGSFAVTKTLFWSVTVKKESS